MFENLTFSDPLTTILGLDVGDQRVGVAIGSADTGVVTPHGAFLREAGEAERKVISLVKERAPGIVVVGIPLSENDELNEQCLKIAKFCRRLRNRITATIGYVDEYASSEEASTLISLHDGKSTKRRDKGVIDALSAMIIVRRFLEKREYIKFESVFSG